VSLALCSVTSEPGTRRPPPGSRCTPVRHALSPRRAVLISPPSARLGLLSGRKKRCGSPSRPSKTTSAATPTGGLAQAASSPPRSSPPRDSRTSSAPSRSVYRWGAFGWAYCCTGAEAGQCCPRFASFSSCS
jgi:hypothetical protein